MVSPSIVDGFTVRCTGVPMGYAGGVELSGGTLRNCVIVNCTAQGIDSPGSAGCGRIGVFEAACGPTGVMPITWGRVKVLFRQPGMRRG